MVLGIIGLVVSGLMTLVGFFAMGDSFKRQLLEHQKADPKVAPEDVMKVADLMGKAGGLLVIASIIGFVIGLIAVIIIYKNRKPLLAGLLFIGSAVVMTFISMFIALLPGCLFLIAGLLCLLRKPRQNRA